MKRKTITPCFGFDPAAVVERPDGSGYWVRLNDANGHALERVEADVARLRGFKAAADEADHLNAQCEAISQWLRS